MWAVTNETRFKVDRVFARDAEGAEVWIVAVRGTFSFTPDGQVDVAPDQQDVCLAPEYFGEAGRTSLRYDMDLVRTKPGTDVVLHAGAHAPGGWAAPAVEVSWTVGPLSKKLRVTGDRVWEMGWSDLVPGRPEPFLSLPIRYEHAWGGLLPDTGARDPFNPVGVGADATLGSPVPNIEDPRNPIQSSRHTGPAAGFGPIPYQWQPRLKFAGTYDEAWQKERQPLVPRDFQDAYFCCAPPDQQIRGFLQGGEEVILRNLTPEGLVRFRLPRVNLGFNTRIAGGVTHHRGELHTVIIEPEERRLILVWQSALPCHHTLYTLKETIAFEKEHVPLGGREREQEEFVERG